MERGGAEPAEGGSARLRALEGDEAGRGHRRGTRRGGRGRPGLAHRVLGDGARRRSGRCSRSTAAASTSSSRTTRTSSRSRARSATSSRSIWTHNGMLEFGGEKMSKSLGNDVSIRNVLDTWGREVALLFFMTAHWRKPIDFTDDDARAGEGAGRDVPQLLRRHAAAPASRRSRSGSRLRSTTTSTRPMRSRSSTTGAAAALAADLRAGLELFGLGSLAERDEAPPEVRRARRAAAGRRARRRTSPRPTGCATRSRRSAGRSATWPAASSSSGDDARAGLRPARGARGAPRREPRGARALGDRARGQGRGRGCARRRSRASR